MEPSTRPAIVLLIGPTGAGKSTFANKVSGSNYETEGVISCTQDINLAPPFLLDGRKVTLVDTPGLDDTFKSTTEIFGLIVEFLRATFEKGTKVDGILYFHPITDVRIGGMVRANLRRFRKLCGAQNLQNVTIVTTRWDSVARDVGARRQEALAEQEAAFKPALDDGARLVAHDGSVPSAHHILRDVLRTPPQPLSVQREMVEEGKVLVDTAVGQDLAAGLSEKEAMHRAELEEVRQERLQVLRDRKEERHQERQGVEEIGNAYRKELEELRHMVEDLTKTLAKVSEEYRALLNGYLKYRESMRTVAQTVQQRELDNQELQESSRRQQIRIAELESQLQEAAAKPAAPQTRGKPAIPEPRPTTQAKAGRVAGAPAPSAVAQTSNPTREGTGSTSVADKREPGRSVVSQPLQEPRAQPRERIDEVQVALRAPTMARGVATVLAVGFVTALRKILF